MKKKVSKLEAKLFAKEIMGLVGKCKPTRMKETIVCIEPNILKITKMKVKESTGFFDPHSEAYLIKYVSMKAINYFVRLLKDGIKEREGEK